MELAEDDSVEHNNPGNIFVDFEGQKIHVGSEYTVEKIGFNDVVKMVVHYLKNTALGKRFEGLFDHSVPVAVYIERLKNGDPETIGMAVASIVAGMAVGYLILSIFNSNQEESDTGKKEKEPEKVDPPRDFTIQQLREFDGTGGKPIYVGLCREVFDMSGSADFYGVGASYHCFAGRESTRAMAKLSFDEEDLASLVNDDFGPFERNTLEDWYMKFKHYRCYPVKGRVSVPPALRTFTREELAAAAKESAENAAKGILPEGRVHAPLYMGIKGKVLDVSYGGVEMYGEGGPYNRFVGIDASRALGKMSFEPADLASSDLSDLTETQLKTLDDWEKKFVEAKKYPVVGTLVA
jgi:membrane-associated progesterone receptor component